MYFFSFIKKYKISFCFLLALLPNTAESTAYIIAGNGSGSVPYAAFVSSIGVVTPITLGLSSASVNSIAVNSLGDAIIGARDGSTGAAYAALISSSGTVTPLTIGLASGTIRSVSINETGNSIIGGENILTTSGYAALVSSSGTVTPLSLGSTFNILSVSINSEDSAIISGTSVSGGYAAFVSPLGAVTPLAVSGTFLYSASINSSGNAIVGGDSGAPYSALISSSTAVTPLTLGFATGSIVSTALNDSGNAIIGGYNSVSGIVGYAALVSSTGTLIPLSITSGTINSVAINSSGSAIIGGATSLSAGYASLVSATGVVTPLTIGTNEAIRSVAIDNTGIALIGGSDSGNFYAALVSPTGVVTPLTGLGSGTITTVAIGSDKITPTPSPSIMSMVVPTSFGPGSSFANASFAFASQMLPNHQMAHRFAPKTTQSHQQPMMADATDLILWRDSRSKKIPYLIKDKYSNCQENTSHETAQKEPSYSIWGDAFGYYNHQKSSSLHVTNQLGGALIGFDYQGMQNILLGCGLAYSFSHTKLQSNMGKADTNQELGTFYFSWFNHYWFLNTALWAGAYQISNTRYSIANITSKASINGWIFLPHLEIGCSLIAQSFTKYKVFLEPFAMFDWANNWQGHIHEKGASGLNLIIGSRYTSLLRSELGMRFVQDIQLDWGHLVIEEKGSYVHLKPFHAGNSTAIFVGSISSFGIEMFSNKIHNLGAVQFNMQFLPYNSSYPYGSFNYQGEFGSSFQSHLGSIEIGKNF